MKRFSLLSTVSLLFILAIVSSSCKKDAEPTPKASFTVYTQITSKFDRLDIYIDNKLVGTISSISPVIPECGTSASSSIFTGSVEPGSRDIEVKQIYQNKEVGIWSDWIINFKAGECIRRKLTE